MGNRYLSAPSSAEVIKKCVVYYALYSQQFVINVNASLLE